MKKWLVFVVGFISGAVSIVLFAFFSTSINNNNVEKLYGATFFEQSGDCISTKALLVIQVVDDHYALAEEVEWNSLFKDYYKTSSDLLVLVTNDNNEYYYDKQIIEIPAGKCMRQIGIYKYQNRMDIEKTVPIVRLTDL